MNDDCLYCLARAGESGAGDRKQETTLKFGALVRVWMVGVALVCLADGAWAQAWWQEPDAKPAPTSWRELGDSEVDAFRVFLEVEAVRRELEVSGSAKPVRYDAPFYPGLNFRLELLPMAWFRPSSVLAPLQLGFVTGKHKVRTSALVATEDGSSEVKIPTRHDSTALELAYRWRSETGFTVTPMLGWRAVEFALGGNPIYTSSFYEGVEFGAGLGFAPALKPWQARADLRLRPSVEMGSTAAAFGQDESVWGWAAKAEAEYRLTSSWLVRGVAGYDRYAGTFQIGPSAASGKAELVDSFVTFLVGLGWAY